MNGFRTTILLAMLTALVVWIGQMVGGPNGAVMALIFAGAMNFFSYWFSDKIVLKMYRAQEVTANDDPELYGIVQELAGRGGLPMPKVYIIPEEAPNAFATGRNPEHAAVAVTLGHSPYSQQARTRRRAWPRAHPCQKSRYFDQQHRRDTRRRDQLSRSDGAMGRDLRRRAQPRRWRRQRWRRYFWTSVHDDRRADGGDVDSDGGVAFARVYGRRGRRED